MKIDRDEMLRYMGVRGSGEGVDAKALAEAESLCLAAAVPKSVVKEFEFDCKTMDVVGTNVFFGGDDIARHLQGCERVFLLAATLGMGIDRLTSRLARENPVLAVMVDAAAVSLIESYLDEVCRDIAKECGGSLTTRFSCGYGDFPLEQQKDFVRLLDMNRKLGVFLGENLLMTPMKSVTAVVGVGGDSATECAGKCASCESENCAYRK